MAVVAAAVTSRPQAQEHVDRLVAAGKHLEDGGRATTLAREKHGRVADGLVELVAKHVGASREERVALRRIGLARRP
jgi:hypothetical protein